jgi:hypothetical protein
MTSSKRAIYLNGKILLARVVHTFNPGDAITKYFFTLYQRLKHLNSLKIISI